MVNIVVNLGSFVDDPGPDVCSEGTDKDGEVPQSVVVGALDVPNVVVGPDGAPLDDETDGVASEGVDGSPGWLTVLENVAPPDGGLMVWDGPDWDGPSCAEESVMVVEEIRGWDVGEIWLDWSDSLLETVKLSAVDNPGAPAVGLGCP